MDVFLPEQGVYRFGSFSVDPVRRALYCDGARLKLAERLFDLLLYLVMNHGRVVERDELLHAVWAGRTVEYNNLGQAVFALRKVLKAGGANSTIITVPGRGFRFAEPVVFEPAHAATWQGSAAAPAEALQPDRLAQPHSRMALMLAMLIVAMATCGLALWHARAPATGDGPATSAFAPPAHSVAVLAFDNMTGDPNQAYVAEGLSEQLIDSLTRIDTLQVAARTSSFSFIGSEVGSHVTVGDIARKLNVSAVLVGSVRRDGARIIVTAQLANALTGFNFWSKTYERDQGQLLDVQADLAQAVARSLLVTLIREDATELALGGTTNPLAFDFYLRGLKQEAAATGEAAYQSALVAFEAAVREDPNFALAYAERANTLGHIGVISATTDHASRRAIFIRALADANHAIALAPKLGRAHTVRGIVFDWGFLNMEAAAADQVRAQAFTPGSATIETNYATAEAALGHLDKAVTAAQHASQLDPMAPDAWGGLARVLYLSRRYSEALEALRRAKDIADSLPPQFLTTLGFVDLMQGDIEGALRTSTPGTYVGQIEVLAIAYARSGRPAEAASELSKLQKLIGDDGAYNYAQIYAQWGRMDDALSWLQTAIVLEDSGLIDIRVDPLLDPLRGTARFADILRRLDIDSRTQSGTLAASANPPELVAPH
jgi:TolB-like protein/DNA-binding winged helix-turn-helix (wHTH) protein/Flp pilus assembly protein TadD